jgi:hypothetical protein
MDKNIARGLSWVKQFRRKWKLSTVNDNVKFASQLGMDKADNDNV